MWRIEGITCEEQADLQYDGTVFEVFQRRKITLDGW
jgi:hypothetical protein